MIHVSVEALVRRRAEIVWGILTDTSGLTAWVEGLVEARVVSAAERGEGLVIEVACMASGKRIEASCEVTAWREPSLLALETRAPGVLVLDRITLAPARHEARCTMLVVTSELFVADPVAAIFARPHGLLGAEREPDVQGVYERSVDALVKRIEALSAAPYR